LLLSQAAARLTRSLGGPTELLDRVAAPVEGTVRSQRRAKK
jgi:hypothetical protein